MTLRTKKKQKTIKKPVSSYGIGVHTGAKSTITFLPAEENTGIQFRRIDLPGNPIIKAGIDHVVETARATILGNGNARIHTIEHVMAALWAFGITNLTIDIDAEEPPVCDGSSNEFVKMLKEAGVQEQNADSLLFKITEPLRVSDGETFLAVFPDKNFKVSYTLDYNHHLVNTQYASFTLNKETFIKEISPSRTFCFYREIEYLMDRGLIRGGSLDNAVVIGDEAILSKEGLRFNDEFARHKILDLIGDLYLLGIRIQGHIIAMKSGHATNVQLAQLLKETYMGAC